MENYQRVRQEDGELSERKVGGWRIIREEGRGMENYQRER